MCRTILLEACIKKKLFKQLLLTGIIIITIFQPQIYQGVGPQANTWSRGWKSPKMYIIILHCNYNSPVCVCLVLISRTIANILLCSGSRVNHAGKIHASLFNYVAAECRKVRRSVWVHSNNSCFVITYSLQSSVLWGTLQQNLERCQLYQLVQEESLK